jgi:hypothetical protein
MPKPEAGKVIDFSLAALFSFCKSRKCCHLSEGSMMEYYDELKKNAKEAGMDVRDFKKYIGFLRYGGCCCTKMEQRRQLCPNRSAEKYT